MRRLSLLVVLLLLLPPMVSAQGAGQGGVALFFASEGEEFSPNTLVLLYETLVVRVHEYVPTVEGGLFPPPADIEGKSAEAEALGADMWLAVTVAGSTETITCRFELFDLRSSRVVESGTFERRGLPSGAAAYWAPVTEALEGLYGESDGMIPLVQGGTGPMPLTVEGVPGTRLSGFTDVPVTLGDDGMTTVQVGTPAFYRYTAEAEGYYVTTGAVYVTEDFSRIELQQVRIPRVAMDLYLSNLTFPGVSLTALGDTWYGRLGLTSYRLGLFLRDQDGPDEEDRRTGYPLSYLFLSAGRDLWKEGGVARVYGELAVFFRLVHEAGAGLAFDAVAPLGFRPAVGAELFGRPGLQPFVEYGPLVYVGDATLLRASLSKAVSDDELPMGYWFGEGLLERLSVDLVGVRVGLRWKF